MMEVGIRELKQRASYILRQVREKKETIIITHRGRAVARLVPVEDQESKRAETMAVLAEADELARKIGAVWPRGVSAAEAVREQRREL
jgi:prevent-host-death family protein